MLTLKQINKEVAKEFPGYEVIKAKDYFYVWGPNGELWDSTMIYVCRVNDLNLLQWMHDIRLMMIKNGVK